MSMTEVQADLVQHKGNHAALMQKYGEQLQAILDLYGGNISDLPAGDNNYAKIQDKIRILGVLSQNQVKRLEPDELEKQRAKDSKKR